MDDSAGLFAAAWVETQLTELVELLATLAGTDQRNVA
jgi:hypothetical protein